MFSLIVSRVVEAARGRRAGERAVARTLVHSHDSLLEATLRHHWELRQICEQRLLVRVTTCNLLRPYQLHTHSFIGQTYVISSASEVGCIDREGEANLELMCNIQSRGKAQSSLIRPLTRSFNFFDLNSIKLIV